MTRGQAREALTKLGIAPASARRMVRYAYENRSSFRPCTWSVEGQTVEIHYVNYSYLVTVAYPRKSIHPGRNYDYRA